MNAQDSDKIRYIVVNVAKRLGVVVLFSFIGFWIAFALSFRDGFTSAAQSEDGLIDYIAFAILIGLPLAAIFIQTREFIKEYRNRFRR